MEDSVGSVVEAETVVTEYLHTQTLVVALMSLERVKSLLQVTIASLTPVLPLLARERLDPVTKVGPVCPPPMSSLLRQQMEV